MTTSRREFLGMAGMILGGGGSLAFGDEPAPGSLPHAIPAAGRPGGPKLAAIASTYHYLSHAYHIVGRFLDGFVVSGEDGFHAPKCEIASLYIEQAPEGTDLGRAKARRHGVRLSPSIEDALTLGTDSLAVDGVLLIAEHGDYPFNDKLQKLYPRHPYFQEVLKTFDRSKRVVPVFIDKHLSYDRALAAEMHRQAKERQVPLMAGSSLPVTWRLPELEIPLGRKWDSAIVASRGEIEIFGFHALETLQCFAERRDRGGKPQGVVAVTCLKGEDVWKAGNDGLWSWELLDRALARSHTLNPGDIRQNTKDFAPPAGRPTFLPGLPLAFVVEYADGFRASALILNGHVDDTTFAARIDDPQAPVVSTLTYLPAPPGAGFFTPLVLRLEDFFLTGTSPYPVERTLLTGGILDAALESFKQGSRRIETPDLAAIDYEPPRDSGFIRTKLVQ